MSCLMKQLSDSGLAGTEERGDRPEDTMDSLRG
jgi:hypothetical protein